MKKTTKTEYFYNDDKKICSSVTTETSDCNEGCPCAEGELLTNEVDVKDEMSAWEILLAAATGAFLGNLLYRVVCKN